METVILETNYSAEYRIITISVASSVFYTNTNIIYTHTELLKPKQLA